MSDRDPDAPLTEEDLCEVANLPKVELHLHHEGAAPPQFIRGLAREKNIDISKVFRKDGSYDFQGFLHFLSVYEAATSVLKTPDDYARLTTAILEESAKNGVVYTESFISPDFCGGGDVEAWRDYLHAIREAADAAERPGRVHADQRLGVVKRLLQGRHGQKISYVAQGHADVTL